MCHKNGTLAVFDYAAVAPYTAINMNGITEDLVQLHEFPSIQPKDIDLVYKDAVFCSPHKFLGGPQASGILIVKKNVLY